MDRREPPPINAEHDDGRVERSTSTRRLASSQKDAYSRMVDAIADGAILLVGSGSSCSVGYPDWDQLLHALRQAAQEHSPAEPLPPTTMPAEVRAEKYKEVLGNERYYTILATTFADRNPTHAPHHERLVSIPFRHILTTNYDFVLERAHYSFYQADPKSIDGHNHTELNQILQYSSRHRGTHYIHVHGSIRNPSEIVLAKSDYESKYHHDKRLSTFLSTLFRTNCIVCVGLGLKEFDSLTLFREVWASCGSEHPIHYALLPLPKDANEAEATASEYIARFGIQIIYYEKACENHSGLWSFISQLHDEVSSRRKAVERERVEMFDLAFRSDSDNRPMTKPDFLEFLAEACSEMHRFNPASPPASSGSEIDDEITSTFELYKIGHINEGLSIYSKMLDAKYSTLDSRQKYRLHANIGHGYYFLGNLAKASHHYITATNHYCDSPDSKGILALGHLFSGKHDLALQFAEQMIEDSPEIARGWSVWIRCQPSSKPLDQIILAVPESSLDDAEVCTALADAAHKRNDLLKQVTYARMAYEVAPEWSDAASLYASAIIDQERSRAEFDPNYGYIANSTGELLKALELIKQAISQIEDGTSSSRLSGYYFNQAVLYRMIGDVPNSRSSLYRAFSLAPGESEIAATFGLEADSPSDRDSAIAALRTIRTHNSCDWKAIFVLAWLLYQREGVSDIEESEKIAENACDQLRSIEPSHLRWDFCRLRISLLQYNNRTNQSIAFIDSLPADSLDPLDLDLLRAEALLQSSKVADAEQILLKWVDKVPAACSWFSRREFALLLTRCRKWGQALSLWTSLYPIRCTGPDSAHIARAAFGAEEWQLALSVTRDARARGCATRDHTMIEAEILVAVREPEKAASLLQRWVAENPQDKTAALQLAAVLTWFDIQLSDQTCWTCLPDANEVLNPHDGRLLVEVLKRKGMFESALSTAYTVYRRFPDDFDAQLALMSSGLVQFSEENATEQPTKVTDNCAVLVGRTAEPPHWIYIVPSRDADVSRNEYERSHAFANRMLGKSVGEKFDFSGHEYLIHQIANAAICRAHECANQYEEKFPSQPAVRRITIPSAAAETGTIKEKLGEVYEVLDASDKAQRHFESMYSGNRLSIAGFASRNGRTVFETVQYLASRPDLGIRCDDGSFESWDPVCDAAAEAKTVVIDGTILPGLVALDMLRLLERLPYEIVVPRSALDDVRLAFDSVPKGKTIGMHRGEIFFHECSPDEISRQVETIASAVRFIEQRCTVVGGESTLSIPTSIKADLDRELDPISVDAIAIARERGCLFWTDDLVVRRVATKIQLDVKVAWTQAIVHGNRRIGRVSKIEDDAVKTKLVACGYRFTRLSADDIAGILQYSKWSIDSTAVRQLIRTMARTSFSGSVNFAITSIALKRVWECDGPLAKKKRFIADFLEILPGPQANFLARFIYRSQVIPRAIFFFKQDASERVKNHLLGRHFSDRPPVLSPFSTPSCRSLKKFLRSWRTRDGEFALGTNRQPRIKPR